jgi:hypothetical protein
MKFKYNNIISINLLLIILFSTIGFNIISTICDGCAIEHTSIVIVSAENDLACECCQNNSNEMSCCKSENDHKEEHHQSTSIFAKLKIDSPETRVKVFKAEAPVLLLLNFIHILFETEINSVAPIQNTNINLSPPLAGRTLLNLICILRN